MIELKETQLNPNIVFANYFIGMDRPKVNALEHRPIYDYELELVTEVENGYMIENGEKVHIKAGDLIFRRPYDHTQGHNRYNSYILCFEAVPSKRHLPMPYQLEYKKDFQEPVSHPLLDQLPSRYHTHSYNKYLDLFQTIYSTYVSPVEGSQLYLRSLVSNMIYQFYKEFRTINDSNHKKAPLIYEVMLYISEHMERDLSLQTLSHQFGYSAVYFHQLFKTIAKTTLAAYVLSKRIDKAKDILVHSNKTIKAISSQVGYNDPSYFIRTFSKETGMTPKTYRETHRITYH